MTDHDDPAALIGWLIWCMDEGYTKAEDRSITGNWLLADESTLTDDDIATKADLLAMGSEVLTAILAAGWVPPCGDYQCAHQEHVDRACGRC